MFHPYRTTCLATSPGGPRSQQQLTEGPGRSGNLPEVTQHRAHGNPGSLGVGHNFSATTELSLCQPLRGLVFPRTALCEAPRASQVHGVSSATPPVFAHRPTWATVTLYCNCSSFHCHFLAILAHRCLELEKGGPSSRRVAPTYWKIVAIQSQVHSL